MLGKMTLGKMTLGKMTLGKMMLGKLMLGKTTLGKTTLGKPTSYRFQALKKPSPKCEARAWPKPTKIKARPNSTFNCYETSDVKM
jgi:hypothetical protein